MKYLLISTAIALCLSAVPAAAVEYYDFTDLGTLGGNSYANAMGYLHYPPVGAPGVPEPAAWAMLIAGFGLVGALMRRRATSLAGN